MAFSYKRSITIDRSKCGTANSTDFPVLISGTYAYLKTVANDAVNGRVQNANGYDIGFYSDSALTTKLSWETAKYVASTGEVIYWVKVPTLNSTQSPNTTDTVIYMAYGDATISTDQSAATNAWESNFKGVWHLNDNAASATVLDATANAKHGTASANTSTLTATGQIGAAIALNGSSQKIDLPTLGISGAAARTISAWVYPTSAALSVLWWTGTAAQYAGFGLDISIISSRDLYVASNDADAYTATGAITLNAWNHVMAAMPASSPLNATNLKLYINGVLKTLTGAGAAGGNLNTSDSNNAIGYYRQSPQAYFPGSVDEVRIAGVQRDASWNAAEYNNQSNPATFYTVGSETVTTAIKTFNGLARASVKTINGLALASVKTWNGLA